jgi:predicted DsbA family dithiol-disulfide isomerase
VTTQDVSRIEVIEFTDPGCSWAWGTEPKLRLFRHRFGPQLRWRRVMGGLVGDMNNFTQDFDPVRAARGYTGYWREVYEHTHMSHPPTLEWMYVSTEPAGKAVKAAEIQSEEVAVRVLRRLREQTFIFGKPPDDPERIAAAIQGVEGLDPDRLLDDLGSEAVAKAFREDWVETRRPNDYVMTLEGDRPGIGKAKHTEGHWRFVFPTLVFSGPEGEATVPGWCPYEDYEQAMESVAPGSTSDPTPDPTPGEVFERWPTATETELETLCGPGAEPPDEIVRNDWGEGIFYLTPHEAEARELA